MNRNAPIRKSTGEFVVEKHEGVSVVRDDLLEGGSKTRFLPALIGGAKEVVFGGPAQGGAPVALSVVGKQAGVKVTLFYAKRNEPHRRQQQAMAFGAKIQWVPFGYMSNVQAKARRYAEKAGALFLPLGFDVPEAKEPFVADMRRLRKKVGSPDEIYCATGSGMLALCLATAFPDSQVVGVAVGLKSRWSAQTFPSNVRIIEAAEAFEEESRGPAAPFPCCPNYDRKAWSMLMASSRTKGRSRLYWNVMGD